MSGHRSHLSVLIAVAVCGCSARPVVQNRQDAAEHLIAGARAHVSPASPDYSLDSLRLQAMPPGSRCVIETKDRDPVRVITATVLKVDESQVVLRTGVIRTLSRDWELSAAERAARSRNGVGREGDIQVAETRFENLRLPLAEIRQVDVYLNAAQASWQRQDEGWRPANRGAVAARDDND